MEITLKREIVASRTACRIIGVVAFIIMTALGAFVRIPLPFTPVPLTLQTFFVILSGAFLGSGLGFAAQLSYILLGLSGLPIFTGAGSGLLYLFGPTGGYLFGFILASLFIGRFIKCAPHNLLFTLSIFYLGDLILLASGVIWLKVIFGYSLAKVLFIGFIPFLAGDFLKALFASLIYLRLKSRLESIF